MTTFLFIIIAISALLSFIIQLYIAFNILKFKKRLSPPKGPRFIREGDTEKVRDAEIFADALIHQLRRM